MMADTHIMDKLLSENPSMHVKDKNLVEGKLKKLREDGSEKLQVIADFDKTLTRSHFDGTVIDTSWAVLRNTTSLGSFSEEVKKINAVYMPIEADLNMTAEEKTPFLLEWYQKKLQICQDKGLTKPMITDMVSASNIAFRDGTSQMFLQLANESIPLLIFSAGIGNTIEEVLKRFNMDHANIKIVSNMFNFDASGKITGYDGNVIHAFNKNESSLQDPAYYDKLKSRTNAVLMGEAACHSSESAGVDIHLNVTNLKCTYWHSSEKHNLDIHLKNNCLKLFMEFYVM